MLRAQGSLQQYLPFCVATGLKSLSDFCITVLLQTCLPDFKALQFPIPKTGYILTSVLTSTFPIPGANRTGHKSVISMGVH